jgi:magnesium transporter
MSEAQHGDGGGTRDERDDAGAAIDPTSDSAGETAATMDEPRDVAARIEEIPAADGAAVLENLPAETAADVAEYLDPETAGKILSEMDPRQAASVLSDMEAPEASMVVAAMAPDDRVDVLEHVPDEQHAAILGEMDAEDAAEVRELAKYPPDSAGGIMTTEFTALPEDLTIEEAVVQLRRLSEEQEQMWYVYVVDRRDHLVGVLSIRDLILARPGRKLNQIMRTRVFTVLATMDQEEVARLFRKYNYLVMPVVDARNRLVGLITFDDAADVIEEEATEDLQKLFGAGAGERINSPWAFSLRRRLGWLEVKLLSALGAAAIVAHFDNTLAAVPILAACMVLVSAVSGNAAAQALAIVFRGVASGAVDRKAFYRIFYRELIVGVIGGMALGITAGGAIALGLLGHRAAHPYNPLAAGGVVAAAMAVNHLVACLAGVAIPLTLKRLRLDPAQSSFIWATAVTDCCGFLATLGLAGMCLKWLR